MIDVLIGGFEPVVADKCLEIKSKFGLSSIVPIYDKYIEIFCFVRKIEPNRDNDYYRGVSLIRLNNYYEARKK
jgi:hypothetical protein